jgi:ABC-type branched-subunit amino acid transport system ATPase component
VDGVSLEVHEGETLGLIGPNGAGKTTLFELISGFASPDSGEIEFAGRRLTRALSFAGRRWGRLDLSPEARAHLGLVRSFQDAGLFPTMTVEEVVMLSLERSHPTPLFSSLVGSQESERPKRRRARELVGVMGLEAYRRKTVRELSTGTRRIVELACMIALEPRLLLLDEPSSGIAQRESEALGGLLAGVKAYLNTTMIVIEHDIPLVMSVSDRVVAMESGRIIAAGSPDEVRADPLVIESYLGGDVTAIQRSGAQAAVQGA